ncbi:MAG: glutamate racemase [Burkholderiaceae bacterium]|nr:glutamate racemase [Burkholderiaceae bacterium]
MNHAAIGFFDSGWGGLSIMKAAREVLPHEDFVYVADCGHAPYGDRTHEYIVERSRAITEFLMHEQHVKAIVIACNTATAEAANKLRSLYPNFPIIGVEPAIKPAVEQSQTNVVGMISTTRTATSTRYHELLARWRGNAQVISTGCPGLMECVERGKLMAPETLKLLHHYLDPMLAAGIDGLVLGCTHYPFLSDAINSITEGRVRLYEPGLAVARHLRDRLADINALTTKKTPGQEVFFVSDLNDERQKVAQALMPGITDFNSLP